MSVEDPRYDDAIDAVRRMFEAQQRGPSATEWANLHRAIDPAAFAGSMGGRRSGKTAAMEEIERRLREAHPDMRFYHVHVDRDDLHGDKGQSYTAQQKASRQRWRSDWHFDWNNPRDEMPPPRRDYYSQRKWKDQPVPPGEKPFVVLGDGTIDLHPSQWSVR